MKAIGTMLVLVTLVVGCATPSRRPSVGRGLEPQPQTAVPAWENPGSLYDPDGAAVLFADPRARRVGDIVVVKVLDSTTAKNKASTTADKKSSVDLGVSNFLGRDSLPYLGDVGTTPMVKAGSTNNFEGDGETKRESSVKATVAARVTRVLPGGVLEIMGAREMRVNGETQLVAVEGLVRARDIAADNTVESSYLADARIEFFGEGVLAEKQRPGWLARILDHVWPF
ncbi:flagellar L-ring protein [Thermodesulfomicrobium sp. WS]|uniref:flagellar basal body L-ring protein FlgH n=1 Tax=Thermodesulfomicrobium sp. WS TaxID=3004129 RepID=UPI002491D50F|nr:flagellar basal body L-ring protein FlgH [Thermodesulfomicrobium sp. WS]BDV01762.1 flagellar L-ring protein [Thermodesulfomicrobium sp. WS]